MSKDRGYVSIHRSIQKHWIWDEKPFSKGQAWVDLILTANYKDEKFTYQDQIVNGKRGTVYRSITYLAERWGWGRDKVRRFLGMLESDGMISLNTTTHRTTITIVNYGLYQAFTGIQPTTDATTNRQPVGSKSATSRQPVGTYNNDNKENNSNKENKKCNKVNHSHLEEPVPQQTKEEIEEADKWFNSL